jgi:hypothetical protein
VVAAVEVEALGRCRYFVRGRDVEPLGWFRIADLENVQSQVPRLALPCRSP